MQRKPNGYWRRWENVETELRKAMDENHGLIPGRSYFDERGLGSLLVAVTLYYGGMAAVRERLGIAGQKYCPGCDQVKEIAAFRMRRKGERELFRDNVCRQCNSAKVADYRRTPTDRKSTRLNPRH